MKAKESTLTLRKIFGVVPLFHQNTQ